MNNLLLTSLIITLYSVVELLAVNVGRPVSHGTILSWDNGREVPVGGGGPEGL